MYRLNIYRVIDGTDNWPLIDVVEGETPEECIEKAEEKYGYGGGDEYHWANPY